MRVYKNGEKERVGIHRLYISPGHEHDIADWKDQEGKPRLMEVVFKDGVAEVESNLADYLITNKYAAKSRLILPN